MSAQKQRRAGPGSPDRPRRGPVLEWRTADPPALQQRSRLEPHAHASIHLSPGTTPRVPRRFLENVELWAFRGDPEAYDVRMDDLLARRHGPLSPVPATLRDR